MSICLFLRCLEHCDLKFNVITYPILTSLTVTVCWICSAKLDLHTISRMASKCGGLAKWPASLPSMGSHHPTATSDCTFFVLRHAILKLLMSQLAPMKM